MRAALLFWAKLVFCYMELLKYCRNVANVKTFWYNEVVPKNRHPHLRLKHRRADAEHMRPETNPIQVSFRMEEYIMKKLSKAAFSPLQSPVLWLWLWPCRRLRPLPNVLRMPVSLTPFFPSRTDCMLLRRMALMFSWLLMRKNGRPSMMAVPLNCSAEPAMHLSV